MVIMNFNNDRFFVGQRVDLLVIYNYSYIQNAKQQLFLSADDNIILSRDIFLFQ
jgi:hypothetical protein